MAVGTEPAAVPGPAWQTAPADFHLRSKKATSRSGHPDGCCHHVPSCTRSGCCRKKSVRFFRKKEQTRERAAGIAPGRPLRLLRSGCTAKPTRGKSSATLKNPTLAPQRSPRGKPGSDRSRRSTSLSGNHLAEGRTHHHNLSQIKPELPTRNQHPPESWGTAPAGGCQEGPPQNTGCPRGHGQRAQVCALGKAVFSPD